MSATYNDLFNDSESEDSDDEIISKLAYPGTINSIVKWSHIKQEGRNTLHILTEIKAVGTCSKLNYCKDTNIQLLIH